MVIATYIMCNKIFTERVREVVMSISKLHKRYYKMLIIYLTQKT